MGQNVFRFTLDNPVAGSKQISEPDGWAKIKIILERDKEYHSVIEMIETPFIFYGSNRVHDGGMDYLDQFKLNDQVTITIEISQDNSVTWETMFVGLIDIQSKQRIDSRKVQYVITRSSLWTKFLSRVDTSVNIQSNTDLDGNPITPLDSINLLLTPQKIQKKNISYEQNQKNTWVRNSINNTFATNNYIQIGFNDFVELNEFQQFYSLPTSINTSKPVSIINNEEAGSYRIQCDIGFLAEFSNIGPPTTFIDTSTKISCFIQINDDAPIAFSHTTESYPGVSLIFFGTPYSTNIILNVYSLDQTFDFNINDQIRIYALIVSDNFGSPKTDEELYLATNDITLYDGASNTDALQGLFGLNRTFLKVTAQTTYQNTESESFFLHDVGGSVIDRIVGDTNKFYSEYLGSTQTIYKNYDNDGCGWPFVLVRGLQLRQYELSEKPFSISFKDWWNGVNPTHNLGIGYETIDGEEVIEVEDKQSFYDEDPIIYFNWANNIVESYDKEFIFNKIKIGYKKWQSEDISGIDDAQTTHEYSTLFETVGQPIDIESDFIAASLAIETTRRTTKIKSADYKFDDDTFIIAINPDQLSSPAGDYKPELDENFNSITNLLNPETRYNSTLTPARNLIRWGNLLFGCLQDYLTSVIKFNKGEGNYAMIGDYSGSAPGICFNIISDALSEKQDISLAAYGAGIGHLFQPIILEFKYPLSYTNYKLIRDNRKNAIAISESDFDHSICFIKRMEYDVINSLASFTVWKK
jgi:hypothetical protein